MPGSEMIAARIAAQAMTLRGEARDSYLRKHSDEDPEFESRVRSMIEALEIEDRRQAGYLATIDPLTSIASTSNEGPETDGGNDDGSMDLLGTLFSLDAEPSGEYVTCDEPASFATKHVSPEFVQTLPPDGILAPSSNSMVATDEASPHEWDATMSPESQAEVNDLCQRFRDAWASGKEPRLVDYLPSEGSKSDRDYIVFQLVLIDVEQRQVNHRPLSEQAYLENAPDFRDAIQSALTRRSSARSAPVAAARPTVVRGGSATVGKQSTTAPTKMSQGSALRYQPLKMHAKGGLGAVYRAKDTELSRIVALKTILPSHSDNSNSRSRFVFEAEVTGSLEHPGIVPVYGLGKTGNGQPYYAMRFIRGESFGDAIAKFHQSHGQTDSSPQRGPVPGIDAESTKKGSRKRDSAKRNVIDLATTGGTEKDTPLIVSKTDAKAPARERPGDTEPNRHLDFYGREFRQLLRRLIDTCNAMQYAHERGVLHRDLKPDNVMLGQYGETLVVDWGLAKLMSTASTRAVIEPKPTEPITVTDSGLRTTIGQAIGTPMYMSSEQALGLHDELTPASDVYSLGGMLFHLVSGTHPIEGRNARDIIINVRQGKTKNLLTTLPSAPKPLASICHKAMAKEPADRYASATALADDIDRWLSDEPVLAHADHESTAEKAGRLIRRYRGWTVSAAVALVSIAIVSIIAALLISRAKQNEEIAKLRATQFKGEAVQRYHDSREAIDTWLVQSNDALQFFPGTLAVRQRLLSVAAEDYARLSATQSEDPDLELERGRTIIRLGDLSQLQEDMTAAKSHYANAIELLERTAQSMRTSDATIAHIGQLYVAEAANAKSRLAIALANENQISDARRYYEEATASLQSLLPKSSDPLVRRYLATTMVNHGELDASQNEFAEARRRFEIALQIFAELDQAAVPNDIVFAARTRELLGRLLRQSGDYETAMTQLHAAVAGLEPLVAANPDHPEYLDALASAFISMATLQRSRGQTHGEGESLRQAVEHYRALVRALPDVPQYSENLSATLTDLGLLLLDEDRCRDAKPLLIEAGERINDLTRRYGNPPYYQSQLAFSQDALGQVLWNLGDNELAQQLLVRSMQLYSQLNEQHPEIADYVERLAIVQSHLARTASGADADDGFRSAAQTLTKLVDEFPEVPSYSSALGHLHYQHAMKLAGEDRDSAEAAFVRARETWIGIDEVRDAATSERLAWLLATCPNAAVQDAQAAVNLAREALKSSPEDPRFRSTLAIALAIGGQVAEATSALGGFEEVSGKLDARQLLAGALIASKSNDRAKADELVSLARARMEEQAPHSQDLQRLLDLATE